MKIEVLPGYFRPADFRGGGRLPRRGHYPAIDRRRGGASEPLATQRSAEMDRQIVVIIVVGVAVLILSVTAFQQQRR
jgi:hypothetical protein